MIQPLNAAPTERAFALRAVAAKRHVMHVTWSMVAGGAEVYALSILRSLNADDFAGSICAIDQGGALESEFAGLKIPAVILHRQPGFRPSLMWRLYQLFRNRGVNVVHTHHFNQILYSAFAARLAGGRLIHTEHSVELFGARRRRVAMRILSFFCQQILVVGPDVMRFMHEQVGIPKRKLRIIYAGVHITPSLQSRASARLELGLDADTPIVLIVARLYPEKNHVLLLQAFNKVLQTIPSARLLIAGGGIEQDNIRAEIVRLDLSEQVQMLGVRRDVSKLLAAADIVTLPSQREGLPLIVLEAMASARAVVATRVGEVSDAVEDQVTGRLVPAGDSAALTKALIELLADPDRCAEMGRHGRAVAESRFDLRDMVAAHEALYA